MAGLPDVSVTVALRAQRGRNISPPRLSAASPVWHNEDTAVHLLLSTCPMGGSGWSCDVHNTPLCAHHFCHVTFSVFCAI